MKAESLCLLFLLLFNTGVKASDDGDVTAGTGFSIHGRFIYSLSMWKDSGPPTWNYRSSSLEDRSRLMLDLRASGNRLGELYLKGKASWKPGEVKNNSKLFMFDQGDYSWKSPKGNAGIVLFANERRFFSGEMIAPLIHDDVVAGSVDNLGIRVTGDYGGLFQSSAILASIGDDWDEARRMFFARTGLSLPHLQAFLSYLYDYPPANAWLRRAILKAELSFFYRKSSLMLSYEQSGSKRKGVFVPGFNLNLRDFRRGDFNLVFPEDGAFFSELRLFKLSIGKSGKLSLVHDYSVVGREFINEFGTTDGERIGNFLGCYFIAEDVFLNAYLKAGRLSRSLAEDETKDCLEASIRGALKGGREFVLRGSVSKVKEGGEPGYTGGYFLGGAEFPQKRIKNGIHLLLRNVNSDIRQKAVAWNSRLALSADLAVSFRFMISEERITANSVYIRCEFRPNNRFYAYVSYGREYIGDAPYLLEDSDIASINSSNAVYSVVVRGDF